MKKLNLHDIYNVGKHLNPLANIEENAKVRTSTITLWTARSYAIGMTLDDSPFLGAAKRAATKLIEKIDSVIPRSWDDVMKIDDEKVFGWYDAYSIKNALTELESVLGNDMPGIAAYLVSKKGIYDTEALIEHAENHLLPEIRMDVPSQAISDLREAGKCLAYEIPTACAFHLWRAVETVMGMYYLMLTGKSLDDDKIQRNWGAYIAALKKAKADVKVTTFLDHIRDKYRNPQTHPEETVTIGEAQGLFGVAMTSIDQMISAVQKLPANQQATTSPPAIAATPATP